MLRIVTYHRVANPGNNTALDPALISATPEAFAQQLDYLRRWYDVVSAADVIAALGARLQLPKRAVMLTFDDAYVDFETDAWPILKQFGLPATLFVPTAYASDPRQSFWWDRLYRASTKLQLMQTQWTTLKDLRRHIKTLPHCEALALVDWLVEKSGVEDPPAPSVIGWPKLRQLASEGVTLAAHSRTHPVLSGLSLEAIRSEVLGSQDDLKREIGSALPIFCYPSGAVDARVVDILRDNNFALGFTTQLGHNDLFRSDPLLLRRTDITMRTSLPIFKIRLLGVGHYIDVWRTR